AAFSSLWVSAWVAGLWAAAAISANTVVVLLCRRFKRIAPVRFNAAGWTASFVLAETAYGICWAMVAMMSLAGADQNLAVAMFAKAVVGVAANAVSTRTRPAATMMSTLPVTLTVAITLAGLGGTLNWSLAALAVGGEIFFGYLARQLHA